MRKYRVKQKGDYYYPQKRLFGFLFWIYYYHNILGTFFNDYNVIYQCNTLKEAWSYIYSKNKISVKKYHYEE